VKAIAFFLQMWGRSPPKTNQPKPGCCNLKISEQTKPSYD
jgi:hypothetical protein